MYKKVIGSILWQNKYPRRQKNGGFIFDECLKWLHGGYKVLLRDYRLINQSSKQKCFWTENNDIKEYNMDP